LINLLNSMVLCKTRCNFSCLLLLVCSTFYKTDVLLQPYIINLRLWESIKHN